MTASRARPAGERLGMQYSQTLVGSAERPDAAVVPRPPDGGGSTDTPRGDDDVHEAIRRARLAQRRRRGGRAPRRHWLDELEAGD